MKAWKRIVALLGMALGAGAIWLAVSVQRVFASSSLFQRAVGRIMRSLQR